MANRASVSPRHLDSVKHQCNTVHGQSSDGRIRIKLQGQNYLVTGKLSQRRPFNDASGNKKWSYTKTVTTPGYQPSFTNDKKVIAWCLATGENFRVVGLFKKLNTKPFLLSQLEAQTSEAVVSKQSGCAEQIPNQVLAKFKAQNQRLSLSYQFNLEKISAQRAAGFDPDLRMSFISAFLCESKANLYRKMGKEFPLPVKRGRGSFWPMSKIEAYKIGQGFGVAA